MRYIILCFIVYVSTTFSGLALDQKDTVDYSRTGDYFPYVVLTEEDSIFYPITYEVELFVNDLYDLDIKNNFFTAEITAGIYSDYDSISRGYKFYLKQLLIERVFSQIPFVVEYVLII